MSSPDSLSPLQGQPLAGHGVYEKMGLLRDTTHPLLSQDTEKYMATQHSILTIE